VGIEHFSNAFLDDLTRDGLVSAKRRRNWSINIKYDDPCQRLFNSVIGIDGPIPPLRYSLDPKYECLITVRGLFALFIFDENEEVLMIIKFGSDLYGKMDINCLAVVEIPPNDWHKVIVKVNLSMGCKSEEAINSLDSIISRLCTF
jgi:hypothetical protein